MMTSKGIPLPDILARAGELLQEDPSVSTREYHLLLALLDAIAKACEEYPSNG